MSFGVPYNLKTSKYKMFLSRFLRVFLASVFFISLTGLIVLVPVNNPPLTWPVLDLPSTELSTTTTTTTIESTEQPKHVNDFSQLINITTFQFLMNVEPCNYSKPLILLVMVHSAPNNIEKRNSIRETWGSYLRNDIIVLFLIGKTNNISIKNNLLLEQNKNNDIIQGNFIDKYRHMTYKHMMAFKWIIYYCNNINYILKTDDDVFINMPNLIEYLPTLPKSKLILCDVILNAQVKRTWRSKWRVSFNEYSKKNYPNYCAGWAILYSRDVVQDLYYISQNNHYFWIDDVHITGVAAEQANIKHKPAEKLILYDNISNKILLNKKWPNINLKSIYLLGPYDTSPDQIKSLWQLLINEISNR